MQAFSLVPGKAHYDRSYESKRRLASFWHQIDECLALGGKKVILIGKGSGLPSIMLERAGLEVTTIDIQRELKPAIVADVRQLPFLDGVFDIGVCCEVLEHLPFECFLPSLRELRRIVRRGLVISVPDRGAYSKVLPYLFFRRKAVMDLPNPWLRPWNFNGEHFWELNTRGYRLRDVECMIDKAGLNIEHAFRVWEYPYHHFWRLTPNRPTRG